MSYQIIIENFWKEPEGTELINKMTFKIVINVNDVNKTFFENSFVTELEAENKTPIQIVDIGYEKIEEQLLLKISAIIEQQNLIGTIYINSTQQQPTYPAWVQPTGAHDAYAIGVIVTYNGQLWQNTINANVWIPGVYGWVVYNG